MAATIENLALLPGLVAGENLTTHQFKPVKVSTASPFTVLAATEGSQPIGILVNRPDAGEAASVASCGSYAKCVAPLGGVTAGAHIGYDGGMTTCGPAVGFSIMSVSATELFTVFVEPHHVV